jgi:hypothetical protein
LFFDCAVTPPSIAEEAVVRNEESIGQSDAARTSSADEKRLHQLGYAQELSRTMSGFSNFAVSFTIISILSGCLTLYGFGMNTGGPVMIVWAGRSSA